MFTYSFITFIFYFLKKKFFFDLNFLLYFASIYLLMQ